MLEDDRKGFKYLDTDLTPGGLLELVLKEGLTPGAAEIIVKGRAVNLPLPTPVSGTQFLAQNTKVAVQLVNSDAECWQPPTLPPPSRTTAANSKTTEIEGASPCLPAWLPGPLDTPWRLSHAAGRS